MESKPNQIDLLKELGDIFNPNAKSEMPEKQFEALKKAVFHRMQEYEIDEGLNTIDVDNGIDVIEIEFYAHIRDEYYGDGINEPFGCDREITIEMITIDHQYITISAAQLLELENEVKLNA